MGINARPDTMHAWRKHKGNTEPVWEILPVPSTPPDGLLIKLLASGVCHSDQPLLDIEDRLNFNERYILGHEGCGEIVEIGEEISDSRFQVVSKTSTTPKILVTDGIIKFRAAEWLSWLFRAADSQTAPSARATYHSFALLACTMVLVKTDSMQTPAVAAVATDAVTTAYHGITRRAEVKREEIIFLFGLGGLGFNALQIVRHIGARVIVSDLRQEKLDAALALGVPQEDIVPVGTSVQAFVQESGLQGKIDTVLEFVGKHQTFQDAQQIVRLGGKILCVGTLDRTNELDMKNGIRKRLSIIFTYGGQQRDLVEVLDLIARKVIQPQVEIGRLCDFPTVLKALGDGKIRDRVALVSDLVARDG
ncbi:hypothetical protein N7532_005032 [Penicillium argentinense]|uniref:Enoyl reductase (ER) domain-containing protein n=1 Tax=Penicillium argentinense TaxID=1131581 RepID=A0A9W9FD50_9EURO|nr:uncharacterized protein N7532_005032 [Penicillium argentinense]KAJ5098031.1 hypothetical protein N7532_005032 [Penicillium argentinense]